MTHFRTDTCHTTRTRRLAAESKTGSSGSGPNGSGANPDEDDHYSLLGVPFTATHAEISRAYRRAMKRAHPDWQRHERRAQSEDMARRLNAAFATLSDPLKRQAYDRTIRQQVIQDQIMRHYVGGFHTLDEIPGPARPHRRREPTAAERRDRLAADRQASLTLILVAAGVTAIILISVLLGSFLVSILNAVR